MTSANKRGDMATAKAIREHWAQWLVEAGKFDSVDEVLEPYYNDDGKNEGFCCFACGFTSPHRLLERAHILALADGGPNSADNLHMLCSLCHKASEFLKGDAYFQWFDGRNVMHRILEGAMRNQTGGATKLPELLKAMMR